MTHHKPNNAKKRQREIYKREGRREKNKLKRVRQSNGPEAALEYAKAHGLYSWGKQRGFVT